MKIEYDKEHPSLNCKIGDTVKFKWRWSGKTIIREGKISKCYDLDIERCWLGDKEMYSRFYDVDCKPSHDAFISNEYIISINGQYINDELKSEEGEK